MDLDEDTFRNKRSENSKDLKTKISDCFSLIASGILQKTSSYIFPDSAPRPSTAAAINEKLF